MTTIKRTTSSAIDFQNLVVLLDKDLKIKDGEEHDFYAQFNKIDKIKNVVVYYSNNEAVGCGAFKEFDTNTVEIKRMFVHPDFRGKGIAGSVLKELENWAGEINYTACVLETGKNNPEAIGLYAKYGYEIIPNYGQYEHVENSVCMKKINKQ
ncbi:GNAT family N-acetyltransferase [Flavobacterium sp. ZB4P13]|uniref:GNAT family N-acetyltransferase n=1 Tax=Flavobacterium sp. ZB4P13 TaxID=3401728 RepID=UPI003AAF6F0E